MEIRKFLCANRKLRVFNRVMAWFLLILFVIIMLSGYVLIGKLNLISVKSARILHKVIMPYFLLLLVFHSVYGIILKLHQRKVVKP